MYLYYVYKNGILDYTAENWFDMHRYIATKRIDFESYKDKYTWDVVIYVD